MVWWGLSLLPFWCDMAVLVSTSSWYVAQEASLHQVVTSFASIVEMSKLIRTCRGDACEQHVMPTKRRGLSLEQNTHNVARENVGIEEVSVTAIDGFQEFDPVFILGMLKMNPTLMEMPCPNLVSVIILPWPGCTFLIFAHRHKIRFSNSLAIFIWGTPFTTLCRSQRGQSEVWPIKKCQRTCSTAQLVSQWMMSWYHRLGNQQLELLDDEA